MRRGLMLRVFDAYVWLICHNACLCRFGGSRLCGRVDRLLSRKGYW